MSARRPPRTAPPPRAVASLRFSRINGILIGAGLAAVAAGYALLADGSTIAAPLLLVLGYAVLIPIGIIK